MGFWQGVNEGLTYVLDKREARQSEEKQLSYDREKFERTLFENNRGIALQVAAEKAKEKRAVQEQVKAGIAMGLTPTVATALLESGELGPLLAKAEKDGYNTQYIEKLSLTVETKLKETDSRTAAMKSGMSTQRDVSNEGQSEMAIMEAILDADSQGELDKIVTDIYTAPSGPTPRERFGVNPAGVGGLSSPDTAAMRRELTSGLRTYFETSFEPTATGEYALTQNPDPAVRRLFNEAERTARQLAVDPFSGYNATDASAFVVQQIESVLSVPGVTVTAQDILDNFQLVLQQPDEFLKSFSPTTAPPPVVVQPSAEEVTDAMGNGNEWVTNVDEIANRNQ